jgi:hypothetical protein
MSLSVKALLFCLAGVLVSIVPLIKGRIKLRHFFPIVIFTLFLYRLVFLSSSFALVIDLLYIIGAYSFGVLLGVVPVRHAKNILISVLLFWILLIFTQKIGLPISWMAREAFDNGTEMGFYYQIENRLVPPALDLFSVPLSYKMLGVFTILSYFFTLERGKLNKVSAEPKTAALSIILLYFMQARSAILALFFFLMFSAKRKRLAFGLALLCLVSLPLVINLRPIILGDGTVVGRIVLFEMALRIIIDNPFGISGNYLDYVNSSKLSNLVISEASGVIDVDEWLSTYSSHNAFLNIGLYYGIFGYLLLGFLIFKTYKLSRKCLEGQFLLVFLGMASINGLFHNAGLIYSDPDFAIVCGFLVARNPGRPHA